MSLSKEELAVFSNAVYKKKSLRYINKNIDGDWILDKRRSKADSKVFINEEDKIIVIAFRGTSNLKDVIDDISIITSREHKNKRWQKARKLVQKVNSKYYDYKVYVVGHSLGGSLAEFASRHTGNETVAFSRGNLKIEQDIKNDNLTDVYNKYDPISLLVGTHKGNKKREVEVDGLNKHSIKSFV